MQLLKVLPSSRGQQASRDDWSRVDPRKKDGRKKLSSVWFPSQIVHELANKAFHSLASFGVIE